MTWTETKECEETRVTRSRDGRAWTGLGCYGTPWCSAADARIEEGSPGELSTPRKSGGSGRSAHASRARQQPKTYPAATPALPPTPGWGTRLGGEIERHIPPRHPL